MEDLSADHKEQHARTCAQFS